MVFLLLFHFSQFILFFTKKKQHFSHIIFFFFPVFFIFVNYITFFFKRNGKVFPLFSHHSSFPETLFHKIIQKSSLPFCTLLIKLRTKLSFYLCIFYTLHNFYSFIFFFLRIIPDFMLSVNPKYAACRQEGLCFRCCCPHRAIHSSAGIIASSFRSPKYCQRFRLFRYKFLKRCFPSTEAKGDIFLGMHLRVGDFVPQFSCLNHPDAIRRFF